MDYVALKLSQQIFKALEIFKVFVEKDHFKIHSHRLSVTFFLYSLFKEVVIVLCVDHYIIYFFIKRDLNTNSSLFKLVCLNHRCIEYFVIRYCKQTFLVISFNL